MSKVKMILVDNSGSYQYTTTKGEVYEVEKVAGIFEGFPYYEFINDNGKLTACHTYRFEPIDGEMSQSGTGKRPRVRQKNSCNNA